MNIGQNVSSVVAGDDGLNGGGGADTDDANGGGAETDDANGGGAGDRSDVGGGDWKNSLVDSGIVSEIVEGEHNIVS